MKTHKVPEEVMEFMYKWKGAARLRDIYVKLPFGFKKARKCAREAVRNETTFWDEIKVLYPELRGKFIRVVDKEVSVIEDSS